MDTVELARLKELARKYEGRAKEIFKERYEGACPAEQLRLAQEYPIIYAEYVTEQAETTAHQC